MEQIIEKYKLLDSLNDVLGFLQHPQGSVTEQGHVIDTSDDFIREYLLDCEHPSCDFDDDFIDELCEAFPHVKELFMLKNQLHEICLV